MLNSYLKHNNGDMLIDVIKMNNLEYLAMLFDCKKYDMKNVFMMLVKEDINEDVLDFIYDKLK